MSQEIKRSDVVPSGINSLDKNIEGGFNRGDTILVAGQPGSGKTTFALQFLYDGATKHNERGLYVTFVESALKLKRDAKRFGWDLEKLEKEGGIIVLDLIQTLSEKGTQANLDYILDAVEKHDVKRLVIDSLSAMIAYIDTKPEARTFVAMLNKFIENAGCTTIQVVEIPWAEQRLGLGFEEFLADAVIILESAMVENRVRRRLFIPKIRGVNHTLQAYDFFITSKGIDIAPSPSR